MNTQTRELKPVGNAGASERKERWGRWKSKVREKAIPALIAGGFCVISAAVIAGTALAINNKYDSAKCAQTRSEIKALAEKSDSLAYEFSKTRELLERDLITTAHAGDIFLNIIGDREYLDAQLREKIIEQRGQCLSREKPAQ